RPVEIAVSSFTGGLRRKLAGMATRAMDPSTCGIGTMLGAKRIRGTQTHVFQGLLQMSAEGQRFTKPDESSKCPFAVRCGSVKKDPSHRTAIFVWPSTIQTLTHARRRISAVEHNLPHERVG